MMVILGLLDLGRAIYTYNTLSQASRQAARMAIVNQTSATIQNEAISYGATLGLAQSNVDVCFKTESTTPKGLLLEHGQLPASLTRNRLSGHREDTCLLCAVHAGCRAAFQHDQFVLNERRAHRIRMSDRSCADMLTTRRDRREGQGGQAIAVIAIALTVVLAAGAMVIDGGNAMAQQRGTQNGADSAALAGATAHCRKHGRRRRDGRRRFDRGQQRAG